MGLARKHRRGPSRAETQSARREARFSRRQGASSLPKCPLFFLLTKPKIEDIPVGATLRPGELLLWIQTPPVFGNNGDERRDFCFPVYLGENVELSPANALLAFDLLTARSAVVRAAVEELKTLARTPAAKKWAAENFPHIHDTHTLE